RKAECECCFHTAKLGFCLLLKMQQKSGYALYCVGWLFYALVLLFAMRLPFFWDTILTSTVADWFYQNGIGNGIAPVVWDAGHPTFFQLYLAGAWKILGQNLAVSHWIMAPFLVLMVWAYVQLLQLLVQNRKGQWMGLVLLLIHPFVLTQSMLVSYDIA